MNCPLSHININVQPTTIVFANHSLNNVNILAGILACMIQYNNLVCVGGGGGVIILIIMIASREYMV